jgi:23S rRNA (cytidine1920-2'-O)/16S rRNA (cytidine1409-2'-O)-methyltransferase
MGKIPLLTLLSTRYPGMSEKELFSAVLRGRVTVDGREGLKPKEPVPPEADIRLRPDSRFASRGGEKLDYALEAWRCAVRGLRFIDAGSSTGGFTDCLLRRGAAGVYAVDVGYNQLDYRLRRDARVSVMERTNVMKLTAADFPIVPDQAVADLAFRSLRKAAHHILELTAEGRGIFLAKPQFEEQAPAPEFDGVVRDASRLRGILEELFRDLEAEGVRVLKAVSSPLRGRRGNREYLLLLSLGGGPAASYGELADGLVRE